MLHSSELSVWSQIVFVCMGNLAWVGTSFQKQRKKSNTMLWTLLQGPYQLLTRFCPHCKLRRLQSLGNIVNLIISFENTCWVLKNVQQSLLLRYLESAEAYNGKRKICSVGRHQVPKIFTLINSLFTVPFSLNVAVDEVTLWLVQVENMG